MPAALAEARKNLDEPAADLHRDRHRADRREHQLLQERRAGRVQGRDGPGAARRLPEEQRRGHRGARRLQDVPAEGPAAEVDRHLRDRRRHLRQGARRQRDDRRAARSAARASPRRTGRRTRRRSRRRRKQIDPAKPADAVLASLQADHPQAGDAARRRRRRRSTRCASSSSTTTSSRFRRRPPARVKETPPFMRSTTSASMDTPGPFEKAQARRRSTT